MTDLNDKIETLKKVEHYLKIALIVFICLLLVIGVISVVLTRDKNNYAPQQIEEIEQC